MTCTSLAMLAALFSGAGPLYIGTERQLKVALPAGGPLLERKLHLNSNTFLRGGWHTGFSILIERYGYDPRLYANNALLDGGQLRPFVGVPMLPNRGPSGQRPPADA